MQMELGVLQSAETPLHTPCKQAIPFPPGNYANYANSQPTDAKPKPKLQDPVAQN